MIASSKKKRMRAIGLSLAAFSGLAFFFILASEPSSVVSTTIEQRVNQLESLEPAYYQSLIEAMKELSRVSKTNPQPKVYTRHGIQQFPEAFTRLDPVAIQTTNGEIEILLESSDSKRIWLTKSERGDTHYILMHYTDYDQIWKGNRYRKREVYPFSQLHELVDR